MTINLHNGWSFVHVPKTGGTWATEVLTKARVVNGTEGHEHGTEHRGRRSWCVLRDPVEWHKSLWAHRRRDGFPTWGGANHPLWPLTEIDEVRFADYFRPVVERFPNHTAQIFARYADAVEIVVNYGDQRAFLAALADLEGWNLELDTPRVNSAPDPHPDVPLDLVVEFYRNEMFAQNSAKTWGVGVMELS